MPSQDQPTYYKNFYYRVAYDETKGVLYSALVFDPRYYPTKQMQEVRIYERRERDASSAMLLVDIAKAEAHIAIDRVANQTLFSEAAEKREGNAGYVGVTRAHLPMPRDPIVTFTLEETRLDDSKAREDAAFIARKLQDIWYAKKSIAPDHS